MRPIAARIRYPNVIALACAPTALPGTIATPAAKATWSSTPISAPYPNVVRPSTTASRGSDRSLREVRLPSHTSSQPITSSSATPPMARNAKLPV